MKTKNLFALITLLCAVLGLLPEASAQNNEADVACTPGCTPMAAQCAPYAHNGAVFQDPAPNFAPTCGIHCVPTRADCESALVTCPAVSNRRCNDEPTSPAGGGDHTPPRPRSPHPPRPPRATPTDICETGAHEPSNALGTCECNGNATSGPLAIYQPGTTHNVQRLQQRDSHGHLHVMCIVPVETPAQTEHGLDCGDLTVCGDTCRDLQHDPNNCGSCGHTCEGGQLCSNGACVVREQATPSPPIPATVPEAAGTIGRNLENRVVVIEHRVRVRPGMLLGFSATWYHLPDESFALVSPLVGGTLTFDRHDQEDGRWFVQVFAAVGPSWTGHRDRDGVICPAVHVETGLRVGGALDSGRIVTLFGGWTGSWDIVPCSTPTGGINVADGVSSLTGPEAGVSLRIYDHLHLNGSLVVPVWARFTRTWVDDFIGFGVAMPRVGAELEWRW